MSPSSRPLPGPRGTLRRQEGQPICEEGDDEQQRGVTLIPGSCRGEGIHSKLPGVWAGGGHKVRVFESPSPSPYLGTWDPPIFWARKCPPAVQSFVSNRLRSPQYRTNSYSLFSSPWLRGGEGQRRVKKRGFWEKRRVKGAQEPGTIR